MPANKADSEINTLIRARYPIIYVVSWEERRVEDAIRGIAGSGKCLFTWTATRGIEPAGASVGRTGSAQSALDFVESCEDDALFVFKDLHPYLSDTIIVRRLRDLAAHLKVSRKTLIIVSPILKLPAELEKDVTVVDYPLPSYEDLGALLDLIVEKMKRDGADVDVSIGAELREQVIRAAQGMTLAEAENVFARSLVEKRRFDVSVILTEKEQIVRKSGLLEYYPATEKFEQVGGLKSLKQWLTNRSGGFSARAREFGLPEPRGILLLGVQGCGKSLSCKA
ncbi:MAG: AAA family ATPase, partial [Armatimonadota bacterium]